MSKSRHDNNKRLHDKILKVTSEKQNVPHGNVRGVLRIFLFERVAGAERLCDCLAEDNIGVVERVEGYRLRL